MLNVVCAMCRVLRSVGGCTHSRSCVYAYVCICVACNLFVACAKSAEPQNELCFVVFLVYDCCFFFFYNSLQALSVVVAALMAVMVGLCAGRSSSLRSSSLRSTVYSLQSSVGSLHSLLFSQVSVPWQKITQFEIRGAG